MDRTIPPELLLAPPRMIRKRRSTSRTPILAIILIVAIILIPVGMSIFSVLEPVLLSHAPLIDGTIIRRYMTHGRKGSVSYHIDYSYPQDGIMKDDSQSVLRSTYYGLRTGQRVEVRLISIGGWKSSELDLVFQNYAAERWPVWAIAGIFDTIILVIIISQYRQKQLLRNGTPVIGRAMEKRITKGKSTSYWVTYEFDAQGGGMIQKKKATQSHFYNRINEGDPICIVYDPMHPRRSLIYDDYAYECIPQGDFGV